MEDKLPDLGKVFELLLEHGGDVITIVDCEARVSFQSPSIQQQLGYDPAELIGQTIFDFIHPADLSVAISSFDRAMGGETLERVVVRFEQKDGSYKKMEVVGRIYRQRDTRWMVLSSRDITASQHTLERLKASERLLHAAFNTTNAMCVISQYRTGRIVDVNEAWVRSTGWSKQQSVGNTPIELGAWADPEDEIPFHELMRDSGRIRNFPATILNKEGESLSLLMDAEVVVIEEQELLFMSAMDVTERERQETQLRQSQRMEAIAQLTGGVAHDLNNMLTVVLGQIDLALEGPGSIGTYQDSLNTIRKATERGSELIRQLMIFSRKQTLKPSVININHCIRNLVPLLEGSIGGEVEIKTSLVRDNWKGFVDEALLENALLNLCLNARDAMPQGGCVTLSTSEVMLSDDVAKKLSIPAGEYIRVEVRDTGKGMDASALANAFEPYFTTKAIGQGTGLGLSMVFGFVTQSGGHVHLESTTGIGTTAIMYLPATTGEDVPSEPEVSKASDLTGKVVMVIEDNDELRQVVCQLLKSLGCSVVESNGGSFQLPDGDVDLILSDVVLPGPSQGPDLTELALEHFPHARVIFMSGYPRDRFADMQLVMNHPLLRKPFSRQKLQQALTEAFEAEANRTS